MIRIGPMSRLQIKPRPGYGLVTEVTPQSANWTYVGFALYRLAPGEAVRASTGVREVCLVLVSGRAEIIVNDADFGALGARMSPFEGKPCSVYVPGDAAWRVTALTEVELAVCSAPSLGGGHRARVIAPDMLATEVRGQGTNTRYVTNILPESAAADSLLVVEVLTPGGHTSSYPPHRHDENDLPRQSLLEETYYHRLNPSQGFALQRIYTDRDADGRRALDEALAVEDGDVTLVPRGYHPCAACHGYDLYYLNVMAGPVRTWKFHNAPEHEWLLGR